MDELISVVIPTYGRAGMLERALSSVVNQTYRNLEIIVVDDNANEVDSKAVSEVCERIDDKRIRVLHNKHNQGGALARNAGIESSKGRFIAFLDDDDEYYPDKIEKQYSYFLNSKLQDLAMVYCYTEARNADGSFRAYYINDYEGRCLYEGLLDCIAATSQWLCDKGKLMDVGMFSDVPCKQDSTVIVKLLAKRYTLGRVPEVLSVYNFHNQPRISDRNHKRRISGEECLIRLCRTQYGELGIRQILEVEYNFRRRVYKHYYHNGNYGKFMFCVVFMTMLHPSITVKKLKKCFCKMLHR